MRSFRTFFLAPSFLLACSLFVSGCTSEKPSQSAFDGFEQADNAEDLSIVLAALDEFDGLTKIAAYQQKANLSYTKQVNKRGWLSLGLMAGNTLASIAIVSVNPLGLIPLFAGGALSVVPLLQKHKQTKADIALEKAETELDKKSNLLMAKPFIEAKSLVIDEVTNANRLGKFAVELEKRYGTVFLGHFPNVEKYAGKGYFIALSDYQYPVDPNTNKEMTNQTPFRQLVVLTRAGQIIMSQSLFVMTESEKLNAQNHPEFLDEAAATLDRVGIVQSDLYFDKATTTSKNELPDEFPKEIHIKVLQTVANHIDKETPNQKETVFALSSFNQDESSKD